MVNKLNDKLLPYFKIVLIFTFFISYFTYSFGSFDELRKNSKQISQFPEKELILKIDQTDSVKVINLFKKAENFKIKDTEESLSILQQAYDRSRSLGSSRLMAESLNRLGMTSLNAGLLDFSVKQFLLLKELGIKEKNIRYIANSNYNIGSIQVLLEQYQEAKISLEQSTKDLINIYSKEGQSVPVQVTLNFKNNLGLCEKGLGNFYLAKKIYLEGIEIAEQNNHTSSITYSQLLLNLSELLLYLEETSTAEIYINKAILYFGENPNKLIQININRMLGKLMLAQNNTRKSIPYFKVLFNLADSLQNYSALKHVSSDLSEVYEDLEQMDSALYYKKLTIDYEKFLEIEEASKQILESSLMEKFNMEKKEMEITFQNKIKDYKISLYFLIGFLISYPLFRIIINSNYYKKHKYFSIFNKFRKIENDKISKGHFENIAASEYNKKEKEIKINDLDESKYITWRKVFSDIDQIRSNNSAWKEHELRLSNFDNGFLEKLLKEYPNLTMNERRLSVFLKLQFSTKEIAQLTGQSVRAVEVARIRLRKKLLLTNSDTSLYDFFINF
ncbi:helix-turn-helix transcriptional regulator [Algoriphagus marincola]|uniref:helix-turn-helix transcriptional regulator n=1 Tax=Algoriphagus marincola TaxID=264027 RepID=UPI0004179DAA|nr:hypothetical protein [Algoriphagus marincola]